MKNNTEIQREAIIEIFGTQYEGRAVNHQDLNYQENLKIEHQCDNIYDRNAVAVLTNEGRELGLFPKDYASLYAPAIDSGRYNFVVEVVKSKFDPKRPILVIKVTSELKNHIEENLERDILALIQIIVNEYNQRRTEYLQYIYAKTVNVDELLSALNKVRLIQKLHSSSADIIKSYNISHTSEKNTLPTKDALTKYLNNLKSDVNGTLEKIQKAYNESLDIDNEEEYHRVQSWLRERRKKFRLFDDLLTSYIETVENHTDISVTQDAELEVNYSEQTESSQETIEIPTSSKSETHEPESIIKIEHETDISKDSTLTEKAFYDWLVANGDVLDTTAKQYISNIHSIEKLYQTLFGVRKNILGANSANDAKTIIETLIQRNEYNEADERRHNSFSVSLNKFVQFADISVEELKKPAEKKNYHSPIISEPFVIKTVDFVNPHKCTYYKPCSFTLNGMKYFVGSWRELYAKFLILLYNDNHYVKILKGLIGKTLYGHRMDFADDTLAHNLRKKIEVSSDFFAEGNLSAVDIIKRIKCLMKFCSIDDDHMIVEYNTQEKSNEAVIPEDSNSAGTDSITETPGPTDIEMPMSPVDVIEKSDSNGFTEWLINVSGLATATAKSYYSSVKNSERIAREQNLKSQRLLSAHSYEEANETLDELLQCEAFIKTNAVSHNSLTAGVRKLLQYLQTVNNNEPKEVIQVNVKEDYTPTVTYFTPDTSKPFALKDAVVEILSSNAPEITKYHEHKDGISSKNLRELLNEYYGKTIGLFEISKLLMLDKTFQSVGKGCYILNEAMLPNDETEEENLSYVPLATEEPVKEISDAIHSEYSTVSNTEEMAAVFDITNSEELVIDSIIDVIKENCDNLQYADGFSGYEVKTLLSRKWITGLTEEHIELLMSKCAKLYETENGYYSLIKEETTPQQNDVANNIPKEKTKTIDEIRPNTLLQDQRKANNEVGHIILRINGNEVIAYDYSDALRKVCEFSINYKPFKMARIAGQVIQLHGNNVFYRKAAPVDGYNKLSNGLQLITIDSLSDLQIITAELQKHCQISDDMVTIISK